MLADCKDNDFPAPVRKTRGDELKLILNNIGYRIKSDSVSDGVKKGIISIIQLLAKNEGLNVDKIVEEPGNKSKPTIERYLKIARTLNMLTYKGSAKIGGYFLTEGMKKQAK